MLRPLYNPPSGVGHYIAADLGSRHCNGLGLGPVSRHSSGLGSVTLFSHCNGQETKPSIHPL